MSHDSRMDERFSHIERKLEEIHKDVGDIKTDVAVNTADLKYHIKRTDILEARQESQWQRALAIISIAGALTVLIRFLVP